MTDNKKKSLHVKTGDRVIVTAGKDKGKTGNVKKAIPSEACLGLLLLRIPLVNPVLQWFRSVLSFYILNRLS